MGSAVKRIASIALPIAGAFFGGTGPDSTDAELQAIAPDHPAFRLD